MCFLTTEGKADKKRPGLISAAPTGPADPDESLAVSPSLRVEDDSQLVKAMSEWTIREVSMATILFNKSTTEKTSE